MRGTGRPVPIRDMADIRVEAIHEQHAERLSLTACRRCGTTSCSNAGGGVRSAPSSGEEFVVRARRRGTSSKERRRDVDFTAVVRSRPEGTSAASEYRHRADCREALRSEGGATSHAVRYPAPCRVERRGPISAERGLVDRPASLPSGPRRRPGEPRRVPSSRQISQSCR